MVELKFTCLRVLMDIVFIVLMFFGFMCGIHYGTRLIGLYFWFIKFLLGIVGVGGVIFVMNFIKTPTLFFIKNASIYADSTGETSVLKAIAGSTKNFASSISVPVFNKLIREALNTLKKPVLEKAEDSPLKEVIDVLSKSKLAMISSKIIDKAFDYVDECILGYCYTHASEEKSLPKCALEAFVLFTVNSVSVFKKVLSVLSIQFLIRIVYWIVFVLWCVQSIKFSLMNLLMCYIIGKLILFVIDDAIFEPMLMNSIVRQFAKFSYEDSMNDKVSALVESIPALSKLKSFITSEDEALGSLEKDAEVAADSIKNGDTNEVSH